MSGASPADGFFVLGTRTIHRSDFLHTIRRHYIAPSGRPIQREILIHPGAVAVVPRIGDDVLLIEQFRAAASRTLVEIPAGKLDVSGEDIEQAAIRECAEEVGYRPGRLTRLAEFYTAPGFTDEYMVVYLATDLVEVGTSPHGAEEEVATVHRVSLPVALGMIDDGEIIDAKSIIGLRAAAAIR